MQATLRNFPDSVVDVSQPQIRSDYPILRWNSRTLKLPNDVAFGHVADGLPDAVGGGSGTGVGEIGECVPVCWVAAVDVITDEPDGTIHHQHLNATVVVTRHLMVTVVAGTRIDAKFALIRSVIRAAHCVADKIANTPERS